MKSWIVFVIVGSLLAAGAVWGQSSPPPRRTLADLVPPGGTAEAPFQVFPLPRLDDTAIAAAGIRKLSGRHLTLYTDLPSSPAVDELPRVFDAAVPQWCDYFNVSRDAVARWHNVGYLILNKPRYQQAGLLAADLPEFLHGYQRGAELWLYEQPSDYYRRHLLLHEGTHAFMQCSLRGSGLPWYAEGVSELLATHRWHDGQLTMRSVPQNKEEVEQWGRIKIVRDGYRDGTALHLAEILQYDLRAHFQVEPYGWCWAASIFLDSHPVYRPHFRRLQTVARDDTATFNERFLGWVRDDLAHLSREWQLYVHQLDYGYDAVREAIVPKPVEPLGSTGVEIRVAADRGWQSSGVRLEANKRYRLEASGRYQLGNLPKPWWCEPNGVTIRYRDGRPLGMVLAAIVDESSEADGVNGFLKPAGVGFELETTLRRSGTLYLRVNDFPAELADNQGEVTVRVREVQ